MTLTFYSYKGGVGRSMGLANVAALLTKWRRNVLVVDWDLDAPGIEAYFKAVDPSISERRKVTPGVIDLVKAFEAGQPLDWHDCLLSVRPFDEGEELKIISAGRDDAEYTSRAQCTKWDDLFEAKGLGLYIEELRNSWKNEFDFVLVDSRTGITDIGGVCTIHLPDHLLGWFTTNRTSMDGVKHVVERAGISQDELPVDRNPLLFLPVPSRDESRTEFKLADDWKELIVEEFGDFYKKWLPAKTAPLDVVEKVRIPYIPYWSFGERLPVVEEGTADSQSIGWAYETLSRLVFFRFEWLDIDKDPEHSEDYLSRAVEVDRPRFGPEYADILYKKASDLEKEEQKQITESIKLAREAIEIWQELLDLDFSFYGPKVARAKSFLSDRLGADNDLPSSISELEEALNIFRRLYEIKPTDFEERYSSSLTTFWKRILDSGDVERAVEALRMAIEDQRRLSISNPTAIDPDLADGLSNLSNLLIEDNRFSEPLRYAQEAVDVYRGLVQVNRARYEADLASSYSILSECLSSVDKIKEALTAGNEAVRIFRVLASKDPKRYERDLASSLNALLDSISQSNIDEAPDLTKIVREAIGVFRNLAQKDPSRYEPELAKNLSVLPDLMLQKSDLESAEIQEAFKMQEEAVEIFRHHDEPELARSLINLSKLQSRMDDLASAQASLAEASGILKRLSQDTPTRYREELDEISKLMNGPDTF